MWALTTKETTHTCGRQPACMHQSLSHTYGKAGRRLIYTLKGRSYLCFRPSACMRVRIPLHRVIPCNLWVCSCSEVVCAPCQQVQSACCFWLTGACGGPVSEKQTPLHPSVQWTHRASVLHYKDSLSSCAFNLATEVQWRETQEYCEV